MNKLKCWIISPTGRKPVRNENTELEIIVGGKWNYYDNPIYLNDVLINPIVVERITNNRGGHFPLHRIVVKNVGFGKHTLQLEDQFVIVFYVNPLY